MSLITTLGSTKVVVTCVPKLEYNKVSFSNLGPYPVKRVLPLVVGNPQLTSRNRDNKYPFIFRSNLSIGDSLGLLPDIRGVLDIVERIREPEEDVKDVGKRLSFPSILTLVPGILRGAEKGLKVVERGKETFLNRIELPLRDLSLRVG